MDTVVARIDIKRPGEQCYTADGMYSVILRAYSDAARLDIQLAVLAAYAHAVVARFKREHRLPHAEPVARMYRVGRGAHRDAASGYEKIVVCRYAVLISGSNCQRAAAVYGEIVVRKDSSVVLIGKSLGTVFRAALDRVLAAIGKGEKHLVSACNVYSRIVGAAERHAAQHYPHLGVVSRIDPYAAVIKRSADDIASRRGDNQIAAEHVRAAARYASAVAVKHRRCHAAGAPIAVEVIARKVLRVGIRLGISVVQYGDAEILSVHKQHRNDQCGSDNGKAYSVNVPVR